MLYDTQTIKVLDKTNIQTPLFDPITVEKSNNRIDAFKNEDSFLVSRRVNDTHIMFSKLSPGSGPALTDLISLETNKTSNPIDFVEVSGS